MAIKILFVGLGSAGQRHLRNLLGIFKNDITIAAYRSHKSERVFMPDMQIAEGEVLSEKYSFKEYENYDEALEMQPDIVFITNPNSMHLSYALKAAQKGCDLFIEKPICTEIERADELVNKIRKNNIICQVGFQYRYHPCVLLMKEYLDSKKLGRVVSVYAEIGECLTMMHKYEDYREMTESRSELGGGVVLSQIHELDFLQWLFGIPDKVYSVGGKLGDFEINVEDTATTLFRYCKDGVEFDVTLHQDFFQYPPVRKCRVIGTEGRLEINTLENCFLYEDYETGNSVEERFDGFARNEMFIAELKDFLDCVKTRREPECNAVSALASTRVALAVKKSFAEKREVEVQ